MQIMCVYSLFKKNTNHLVSSSALGDTFNKSESKIVFSKTFNIQYGIESEYNFTVDLI